MRTRVLIKRFDANEDERSRWILGSLRLHIPGALEPEAYITIPKEPSGLFPLAPNLSAETWTARPRAVKRWIAFEADIVHVTIPGETSPVTSARFKLGDESSWYVWTGAAWVVDANAWNTEAEISENIATFPVAARSIRVRVNLATTDVHHAPRLRTIKLAYEAAFDHMDDYLLRSLIRSMKTIRPIGRAEGRAELNSNEFPVRLDSPYQIRGILAAFDITDDPDELENLYQSWSPDAASGPARVSSSGMVTLSQVVSANHVVRVHFEHEPQIAHTTSTDYIEVNRSPSVSIIGVDEVDRGYGTEDHVINVHDGHGVKVLAPRQVDIRATLEVTAPKLWDVLAIGHELKRFFGSGAQLTSFAMDEQFSLWAHDPFSSQGTRGNRDLYRGSMSVTVQMAVLFERGHVDAYSVKALKVNGGNAKFEV